MLANFDYKNLVRVGQKQAVRKARKNGIKSRLAVFGCQTGKRADSQRNSKGEKAQYIVVFWRFERGILRRAMPILFRVVPW